MDAALRGSAPSHRLSPSVLSLLPTCSCASEALGCRRVGWSAGGPCGIRLGSSSVVSRWGHRDPERLAVWLWPWGRTRVVSESAQPSPPDPSSVTHCSGNPPVRQRMKPLKSDRGTYSCRAHSPREGAQDPWEGAQSLLEGVQGRWRGLRATKGKFRTMGGGPGPLGRGGIRVTGGDSGS